MPFRYVPFLRSKAGEADALQNLSAAAKRRVFPVFQLVKSPPSGFATRMLRAWAGLPMALDGQYNLATTGATTDLTNTFRALGRGHIPVIPAIDCDTAGPYLATVQRLVGQYAPGLVVKATLLQLPKVDAWATAQGWRSADVDLVITAGQVSDFDPEMFDDYVRGAISDRVRAPRSWRTLTLASSAAPKDYSAFPVGRTEVPRLDWSLWNTVHASFEFQLDYGDHGTVHPDLTEPPGVAMVRASVSVRYTLNHHWIIQKGHATTGARGQPMARQYLAHARALVADPQFGGVANCWGDDRILQIAAGATTSGSRATWVANSMNRHLSLVADRLP